jgi:hypothetical protein
VVEPERDTEKKSERERERGNNEKFGKKGEIERERGREIKRGRSWSYMCCQLFYLFSD